MHWFERVTWIIVVIIIAIAYYQQGQIDALNWFIKYIDRKKEEHEKEVK